MFYTRLRLYWKVGSYGRQTKSQKEMSGPGGLVIYHILALGTACLAYIKMDLILLSGKAVSVVIDHQAGIFVCIGERGDS